jgi:hypothetical protein
MKKKMFVQKLIFMQMLGRTYSPSTFFVVLLQKGGTSLNIAILDLDGLNLP